MRQPQRGQLVIDSSDAGHVIATFNPILLAVFTRVPREEELATLRRRANEAIEAKIAGGMLYVVARRDMSGGIDPKVRAFVEELITKNQGGSGSNAVVVLTEGFAAAIVRGVVGGLVSLAQRRQLLRVFGSIDEACGWLAAEHQIERAALRAAYDTSTAHLTELRR